MKVVAVLALILLIAILVVGQPGERVRMGMVLDWTEHHVLFPASTNYAMMARIQADPRYQRQWWRRRHGWPGNRTAGEHQDWSLSLGGGVGGQTFPSKFVFDYNQPPSCTGDFVVTGINIAGGTRQANIVGVNQLYRGTGGGVNGMCGTGTAPNIMFAYNIGPGTVPASVAVSQSGTKVAFIEDNGATTTYFHVLTYTAGTNNGSVTSPATLPTGADSKLAMPGATTNTIFVDYTHDVAYATSGSTITKFSPVFNGTLTKVTTGGWPFTISGAGTLSTPVYDQVSRHVFVEDTAGTVWYVDDSGASATAGTNHWNFSSGDTARPPIVDSTNQKIYMYSPNGSSGSIIGQADTSLTPASIVVAGVGAAGANLSPLAPNFSNGYYAGTNVTTAFLYAVGNDATHPALYRIGFHGAWLMNSTAANGPLDLTTAAADASAVTEFYNSVTSREYLFIGSSASCATGYTAGCIRSIDITSGFPSTPNPGTGNNNAIAAAAGGTSGIVVDNNSSSGQAASVYYITLTGNALVKSTQSGLH